MLPRLQREASAVCRWRPYNWLVGFFWVTAGVGGSQDASLRPLSPPTRPQAALFLTLVIEEQPEVPLQEASECRLHLKCLSTPGRLKICWMVLVLRREWKSNTSCYTTSIITEKSSQDFEPKSQQGNKSLETLPTRGVRPKTFKELFL